MGAPAGWEAEKIAFDGAGQREEDGGDLLQPDCPAVHMGFRVVEDIVHAPEHEPMWECPLMSIGATAIFDVAGVGDMGGCLRLVCLREVFAGELADPAYMTPNHGVV